MKIREMYELVVETISKQKLGTYTIYEVVDIPDFLNHESKYKELDGNYTFPYILTEKATEKDYEDYIDYVLAYTGQSIEDFIIVENETKKFKKFSKN